MGTSLGALLKDLATTPRAVDLHQLAELGHHPTQRRASPRPGRPALGDPKQPQRLRYSRSLEGCSEHRNFMRPQLDQPVTWVILSKQHRLALEHPLGSHNVEQFVTK